MMNSKTIIRSYSELTRLRTFEERYEYLKLGGRVGTETFGVDRYFNQLFYTSDEWKEIRNKIIVRDDGCDLGIKGYDIHGQILIHHMNAITMDDIINRSDFLLDPEYLITTRLTTHNAIHYGTLITMTNVIVERTKNDTCPWRHN